MKRIYQAEKPRGKKDHRTSEGHGRLWYWIVRRATQSSFYHLMEELSHVISKSRALRRKDLRIFCRYFYNMCLPEKQKEFFNLKHVIISILLYFKPRLLIFIIFKKLLSREK